MSGTGHNRFYVYAEGAGRAHGHVIEAPSFEAAAVGYAELFFPPVNAGTEVRLFVSGALLCHRPGRRAGRNLRLSRRPG